MIEHLLVEHTPSFLDLPVAFVMSFTAATHATSRFTAALKTAGRFALKFRRVTDMASIAFAFSQRPDQKCPRHDGRASQQ